MTTRRARSPATRRLRTRSLSHRPNRQTKPPTPLRSARAVSTFRHSSSPVALASPKRIKPRFATLTLSYSILAGHERPTRTCIHLPPSRFSSGWHKGRTSSCRRSTPGRNRTRPPAQACQPAARSKDRPELRPRRVHRLPRPWRLRGGTGYREGKALLYTQVVPKS